MAHSRYQSYLRTIRALTGATYREAQLTWHRLGPWLDAYDQRSSAAIARHPKKLGEYLALAQGFVPPKWKVEVSLRTKGGTYRRGGQRVKDRRPLYVKIIVQAREALPIAEFERAVRLTIRAGAVPLGFTVKYADWEKGEGRAMQSGVIRGAAAADLVAFYGALKFPSTTVRAAMVREEDQ